MKLFVGVFAGILGVVLIIAGANGSIENLAGSLWGFSPKSSGTINADPGPGVNPATQSQAGTIAHNASHAAAGGF